MGFVCAVCRKEMFVQNEISVAPCGHLSHHECWLKRANSICPKCGRSFWRDYLKKVYLEDTESTRQSQMETNTKVASPSVRTEITKLQEELQILKKAVYGGKKQEFTGTSVKTEPSDSCQSEDSLSTVIYNDFNWNTIDQNLTSKERQLAVSKHVGQLAVSTLPTSTPSCLLSLEMFGRKIDESLQKFTADGTNDGYDINISMRPSNKQLFRFELDLSKTGGKDGGTLAAKNQNFEVEFNLKMTEYSEETPQN